MIQHLLLMTFAPALILLANPCWPCGMACRASHETHSVGYSSRVGCNDSRTHFRGSHCAGRFPPSRSWRGTSRRCLLRHCIPARCTHLSRHRFRSGISFWWPVIEPWPSSKASSRWPILLYLFLATLPCDILSGFLVFSERIAYPVYFSAPRHFGLSGLADQECAGALMWTVVTVVYLVPAAIITTRLLSPRRSHRVEQEVTTLR